jgi:hypothetical protein
MTATALYSAASLILDVLHRERQLLLSGRVAEACALAEEKLRALADFEASIAANSGQRLQPSEADMIRAVHVLANENSMHFESIRTGMESLIRRMNSLQGQTDVGAYSKSGVKKQFQRSSGAYSRLG